MAGPYSDPYEEWKSMGRPGGSFSAWMASQNATPEVGAAVQPLPSQSLMPPPPPGGQTGHATAQIINGRRMYWDGRQWRDTPGQSLQSNQQSPAPSQSTPTAAAPTAFGVFNLPWGQGGAAQQSPAAPQPAPTAAAPTPDQNFAQMIRNLARSQGWSEDFARFDDNQINAWGQYWDPNAQRFRGGMYGGQEGFFEKPTECPPGTTLHGTNCIPMADAEEFWATGRITGAGAPRPQTPAANPVIPAPRPVTPAPGGPYGGVTGGQNVVNTGSTSVSRPAIQSDALTSVLAPLQGQPNLQNVASQSRQGALPNLLGGLQRRQRPVGSWF